MSVASDALGAQSQPATQTATIPSRVLTGRSRMGRLTGIELAATGIYVPEHIVENADLAQLGCDSDWIVQRTGILQRRKAAPDEATSDLALKAAQDCLQRAGASAADVDLIIVATMTPTIRRHQRLAICSAPWAVWHRLWTSMLLARALCTHSSPQLSSCTAVQPVVRW